MLQSLLDDFKIQFRHGNMITRIILINFSVFIGVLMIKIFTPGSTFEQQVISWLAWPGDPITLLKQPWSVITYMFLHEGIWHLAWNMIMLYWFGKIFGDLLGDQRVLPLYLMGGLVGGLSYFVYAQFIGGPSLALGASAAVMTLIVASAWVAPDYMIRLLLIGDVRLKYIAFFLVLIDVAMISEANNTGGRITHLGGAAFGAIYIILLNQGTDLGGWIINLKKRIFDEPTTRKAAHMKVVHKKTHKANTMTITKEENLEQMVDEILDKIKSKGYDSLTTEEKDVLYRASKK